MDLMLPDSGLLFWMTIIFAIVFFVLARFGFPIIIGMVEKRNKRIADSLEAARIAEEALAGLRQEQERMIAQTRAEQAKILKEAAEEREDLIAMAQEQAKAEAQKMLDEARIRIRQEKEEALRDIRNEAAILSVAIAEKVLRKELSEAEARKEYAERLIGEL